MKFLPLFTVLMLLSGCETFSGAYGKHSSIAWRKDSGGSLSIWNAEMSAAIAYADGQICMQRALAVKTIDTKTSASISDAILKIKESAEASSTPEELAQITTQLKTTAELLTTTTERTAFLDLGLFYLCQISANGTLTDTQNAELIKILVLSGAAMTSPGSDLESITDAIDVEITEGENLENPRESASKLTKLESVLVEESIQSPEEIPIELESKH